MLRWSTAAVRCLFPRRQQAFACVPSSWEFCQDTGRAKKAASEGPVFITNRGKLAHVLLSIEDYQRLIGGHRKIADALAMPDLGDIAFDPPRANIGARPADFS